MVFSLIIIIASAIFGSVYFVTIQRNYVEMEEQHLQTAADNYGQQFRSVVDQMEQVIQQLISSREVLESIWLLAKAENGETDQSAYYTEAKNTIWGYLNTDYYKKNFNRVVHFMQNGSVISGTNYMYYPTDSKKDIDDITWLDRMEGKEGEYVLLELHSDDWARDEGYEVISVVKQLIGKNLGYLEVQERKEDLDELFSPGNDEWNLYIYQGNRILYSSSEEGQAEDAVLLQNLAENLGELSKDGMTYSEAGKLVAVSKNYKNQIRVAIVDSTPVAGEAIKSSIPFVLALVCLMGMVSFIYVWLMSRYMVKPIHQLKSLMESTDINELEISESVEIKDKEFRKLYESYEQVLVKLSQSIQKERFLSELQKQAQFDLLQAQVNPHFLFNVLNVISGRGAAADDEVICDICADLGQMLRYSTDIQEKQARLGEEMHYLTLYLELLKFRYEDMLEYEIIIDEKMKELKIPKMVVQQIVENSIAHGYQSIDRVRKIPIEGYCDETCWMLKVRDNGTGIAEEIKAEIYRKWDEIRAALSEKRRHVEMSIGGMGLVNTYARLYQIYGEAFLMEIHSLEEGMEVSISVREVK